MNEYRALDWIHPSPVITKKKCHLRANYLKLLMLVTRVGYVSAKDELIGVTEEVTRSGKERKSPRKTEGRGQSSMAEAARHLTDGSNEYLQVFTWKRCRWCKSAYAEVGTCSKSEYLEVYKWLKVYREPGVLKVRTVF
jgi:hypothetical protein